MVTATIVHNVGGVPGLHIALDGISEAVERRLFQSDLLFGGSPESAVSSERQSRATCALLWDDATVWKTINRVGDLFPERHVPFDQCTALTYPVSSPLFHFFRGIRTLSPLTFLKKDWG